MVNRSQLFDVKESEKVTKIICASFCLAPAHRGPRSMTADRSQERILETPRRLLHRGSEAPQPAPVPAQGAPCAQILGNDAFEEPWVLSRGSQNLELEDDSAVNFRVELIVTEISRSNHVRSGAKVYPAQRSGKVCSTT